MNIRKIIKEEIDKIVSESDRHRKGYWKERWAKQKAAKNTEKQNDTNSPKNKPSKTQKDRHRKGYYHDYNQAHPERLNRGFTKGYNNGNVSDGKIGRNGIGKEIFPGVYIIGYDEIGRPITNSPLSDMLRNKEMEWHDDDWDEGSWDD